MFPDGRCGLNWVRIAGTLPEVRVTKLVRFDDIDRTNVHTLRVAFTWDAKEAPIPASEGQKPARPGNFQATPLAIGELLWAIVVEVTTTGASAST